MILLLESSSCTEGYCSGDPTQGFSHLGGCEAVAGKRAASLQEEERLAQACGHTGVAAFHPEDDHRDDDRWWLVRHF